MADFPRDKKWQMIHQDRLQSWQQARSRLGGTTNEKRSTLTGPGSHASGVSPFTYPQPEGSSSRSSNVGSAAASMYNKVAGKSRLGIGGSQRGKKEQPEWYIKKFMDRSADQKVVAALGVALRTYEIECVGSSSHSL